MATAAPAHSDASTAGTDGAARTASAERIDGIDAFDGRPEQAGLAMSPASDGATVDPAPVAAPGEPAGPSKSDELRVEASAGHSPARWIAVAGGLGYFPVAPGTAGAFAGVLVFLGVFAMGLATDPNPTWWRSSALFGVYALVVALLFMVGVWASGRAEHEFGRKDDGRIVIDEVVGQLVTLAPILLLASAFSSYRLLSVGVVTGFVLFRLFDIWKPGAVRWAERSFDGGLGVMADDFVAGLYGAVSLFALCGLAERLGWITLDGGVA